MKNGSNLIKKTKYDNTKKGMLKKRVLASNIVIGGTSSIYSNSSLKHSTSSSIISSNQKLTRNHAKKTLRVA